jgi:HK97 family phage portal protein
VSLRNWLIQALGGDLPMTPITDITTNSSTWGGMFGPRIPGLPVVSEQSIMMVSAAYACVNLIAGAISSLPINLFRRDIKTDERQIIPGDDLWWVLNEEFLARWSAANGWEFLVQSLLFHGDAFARIVRRGSTIIGLEPFHPSRVQVMLSEDRTRLIYAVARETVTGQMGFQLGYDVLDQDDMLHVAGFGFNGLRGLSPLRNHLAMTGSIALATQEFAGRFFGNNARPDIVISSEQSINAEKAEEIRKRWEEIYGGLLNSHKPAVLGHGAKIHNLSFSAEDAQLLLTRKFAVEEIARIYGVPPFMIGHVEKTTSFGKGIEHMGIAFVRFTLRQHLNKFEREINRKFFFTKAKFAEFDTFELEKADMKTLFESFATALGNPGAPGFLTADEVRAKLNYKKKGGDADKLSTGAQAPKTDGTGKPKPEEEEDDSEQVTEPAEE